MRYRGLRRATLSLLFLTVRSFASQCFVNFGKDKYPSCVQLSSNVSLHWVVQNGSITWAIDVDGLWDWVGVGISEGGMLGADVAVAAHDTVAHQWTATDYWSTDFVTPKRDTQQDVTLISISRQLHSNANGNTLVAMSRPLVTCDPAGQDKPVLNDTRQTVVFAYGTGPFGYHGPTNRGQADVVFLPNTTAQASSGSNPPLQTLDLRMASYAVPTDPTTYTCVNLELPSDAKYHIYSYEPIIDNAQLVHHFVVYTCRGDGAPDTPVNQTYDCLEDMECEEFYVGWAPGVGKVEAPAEAALAFGEGTGTKYVSLQIHYTNLKSLTNQTDSSGMRISYSSTLKKYDMGILTLGTYEIAVPPGPSSWTTPPNVCPAGCTKQLAAAGGSGGLTLVESFYHMHQLGRSMVTRHVRNGVELPPLGSRDYYAFEYQNPVTIPPGARQLLPGDVLITTCTYTGEGRSNVTSYGPASYQEMCFNFLTYYPYNPNITDCVELPASATSEEDRYSTCASNDILDQIGDTGDDDFTQAVQAGYLVKVPEDALKYKSYQPTCTRSVPGAPGGGGAIYDDDDDDDDDEEEEKEHRRHQRNVGGAVAGILLVTLLGAIAIVVVYRIMKKKRQLEEEQHLFEKYNPSSIILPVMATAGGAGAGAAAVTDSGDNGGNSFGKGSFGDYISSSSNLYDGDQKPAKAAGGVAGV